MSELLLDRAGRRRSPATMPGFHAGHAAGNKGLCYPADPPKVEEIIAVMRASGDAAHGRRLRGLIVIMWRAGLRIQEALALTEGDLDPRGAVLARRGKGGRRREVGMDAWGWEQLEPWLDVRRTFPVGPLLSSTARRADGTGRRLRHVPSFGAPPARQECGVASRHISSVTPTPSRWPAKASR
jgi:integrase